MLTTRKETHVNKTHGRIGHDVARTRGADGQENNGVKGEPWMPRALRRNFIVRVVYVAAVIVVAVMSAPSLLVVPPSQAQGGVQLALAQNQGSPDFANPPEVRYRDHEKRLRAVMKIISGNYLIPNIGTEALRQYRGWDPADPEPRSADIGPGPTLRARLGDKVEISFLNEIDDSRFPYTFDTENKPGHSSYGCDQSGTVYPGADTFPNCFHGSSTANIHFHGTHTSPDGLSDNVFAQVLPQPQQPDWSATFNRIFDSGVIPQKWTDLPLNYRTKQMEMLRAHDDEAAKDARKNGLLPPESLADKNQHLIDSGQWPQYFMGAFPNFFQIPDYDTPAGKFNSGGNHYEAGQAPGTHWYHAHKHGATSLHILSGLAGALIIESSHPGGYDHFIRDYYSTGNSYPWGRDSYGEHEKILVFQQFDPTQNLERVPGTFGKGSGQVLVNGRLTPTIKMRPGEVQLWRLINATEGSTSGVINNDLFKTAGFKFKQTAMDGVQFSPANYAAQPFLTTNATKQVPGGLTLAGGNRADLLVQAPTTPGVVAFKSGGKTLFFVNVTTDTAVTWDKDAFPKTWAEMPKFLDDLRAPDPKVFPNSVQFQWESNRAATGRNPFPPHFMINGKQFAEMGETVDQCMPLGGVQDWILENYTSGVAHPFHIHINPFQVISIETPSTKSPVYSVYNPPGDFVWQDVIAIPPAIINTDEKGNVTSISPGRVRIRHTFPDFTGTYVLHCHILAHEDRGMMQIVRVVPAKNYPAGCQQALPDHH